jgi:hypothetical protein
MSPDLAAPLKEVFIDFLNLVKHAVIPVIHYQRHETVPGEGRPISSAAAGRDDCGGEKGRDTRR